MLTTIINGELNTRNGLKFISYYANICHIASAIEAIEYAKQQLTNYIDMELSTPLADYDADDGSYVVYGPSQLQLNLEYFSGNEHETRRILTATIRARIQTINATPVPFLQLDDDFDLPF